MCWTGEKRKTKRQRELNRKKGGATLKPGQKGNTSGGSIVRQIPKKTPLLLNGDQGKNPGNKSAQNRRREVGEAAGVPPKHWE